MVFKTTFFSINLVFVVTSPKSHNDGGELDHLVAYSMACTIENSDECEMKYRMIRFGSYDEVIKVGDFLCHDEGKRVQEEGFKVCLVRG